MVPGSSDPNRSGLPGANQAWRSETWLFGPCPWCQARPGHVPQQGHGVGGGPSTLRWVHGWRTKADPPGELFHAVHCTNLSRETSPIPKDQVVMEGRSPHHGASCPLSYKAQPSFPRERQIFSPCQKATSYWHLTVNWDEVGRYFHA